MRFKHRSYEKELLDHDTIPTDDLYQNLRELDVINTLLGGYQVSLRGFSSLMKKHNIHTLLDIGFGGGDSIKQLARFAKKKNRAINLYGVDLKQDCVNYATANLKAFPNVTLLCDDYQNISEELLKKIDLIHCSLFLHHLTDQQIVALFQFCRKHHCIILANDLHRHWLAFYSIKWLTALFSKSYLVKNDAAVSVKRGFKKNELIDLVQQAGFTTYSVKWSWAFRFILIAEK